CGTELAVRTRNVEIGQSDEVHAGRAAHLSKEHRAELAGADQPDRDRPAGGLALEQHGVKIHRAFLVVMPGCADIPRCGRSDKGTSVAGAESAPILLPGPDAGFSTNTTPHKSIS